jgi:hypothetical protein
MMQESNKTEPQLDNREQIDVRGEGKGGGTGATPGGNKTEPQLDNREQIDVRNEDSQDTQLGKRELVPVRKETGGGVGPTPGGNKTDPQKDKRELVRMDRETGGGTVHSEEASLGAKDSSDRSDDPDYTTYAGDKDKDAAKEFASRPKITVRHEALGSAKAQKLFGPDAGKKAPGNKKPLLMLVLMGKSKKAPMSEGTSYCPNCGTTHTVGMREKSRFGPMRGLFPGPSKSKPGEEPKENCPTCAGMRRSGGPRSGLTGGLNLSKTGPKSSFESRYGRTRLNLAEGKKKKLNPPFLANIEKMKAKAKARKADKACY